MNKLPMHNALKTIAWLEGTWRTKDPGHGEFPTIKSFNYHEEIKFTSIGQPMFNYEAQSWHPETKNPMHREVGFLRIIPNTNDLKLVLSHNFGLATIEEGQINPENHAEIILNSNEIARMSTTKHPHVTKLKRVFKLIDNDTLEQILYMATSSTPELTKHLSTKYSRH